MRDSIVDVPDVAVAAPVTPGRGVVVRRTLDGAELGEGIEIQLALRMRNFTELLGRVQRGEGVSTDDMSRTYLPLQSDYDRVVAWVQGQRLTITATDPNRLAVFATGRVRDIGEVFQASFARVRTDEGEFTSAVSEPMVPTDLASVLVGVNGLQPQIHPRKHFALVPYAPGSTTGNGPPFLPSQIAHAYHADGLSQTGSGQKTAIVIDTFPATSDLTSFWTACGVSQSLSNIELIQAVSGQLPSPSGEETLDVEWASSIAPGSKVRVYAATSLSFLNIDKAYQKLISDLPNQPALHQLSLSYGAGESYVSNAQLNTDDQYLASIASHGVTVLVSSGDGGSSPGTSGHDHTGPVQTETPASDPNVTGVGGTSLHVDSVTGNTTSETAWYDSGGGTSRYFSRPTWQTGSGLPSGTMRAVPDVSSAADSSTGGYMILNGQAYIVGGTSWSAPTWAGFCALINQARAALAMAPLGTFGPKLYPLLGTSSFVDITVGSNGPNGVYNAGAGYDLCTGIGVPNVTTLLQTLAPVAPVISGQPQSTTVSQGQPASFMVTATGTPAPSCQWQISTNGGTTWTGLADTSPYSGTASTTLQISAAPGTLSGAAYRCVVSNVAGTVTSASATLTVIIPPVITSATTATVTFGQTFTYTITATNSPTSFGATGLPAGLSFNAATATISGTPSAAGAYAIPLSATNQAGTGTATLNLTVNRAAATVTLGALNQTYDGTPKPVTVSTTPAGLGVALTYGGSSTVPVAAGTYAVSATVTDPNYSGTASGTLTVAQASQTITFAPLSPVQAGSSPVTLTASASSSLPVAYQSDNAAVATISGSTLTIVGPGTANITATQSGNANYLAASPVTQPIVVNPQPPSDATIPALPLWGLVLLALLLTASGLRVLTRARE